MFLLRLIGQVGDLGGRAVVREVLREQRRDVVDIESAVGFEVQVDDFKSGSGGVNVVTMT